MIRQLHGGLLSIHLQSHDFSLKDHLHITRVGQNNF